MSYNKDYLVLSCVGVRVYKSILLCVTAEKKEASVFIFISSVYRLFFTFCQIQSAYCSSE